MPSYECVAGPSVQTILARRFTRASLGAAPGPLAARHLELGLQVADLLLQQQDASYAGQREPVVDQRHRLLEQPDVGAAVATLLPVRPGRAHDVVRVEPAQERLL